MWERESQIWWANLESTLSRTCIHPKSVILDIYQQIHFPRWWGYYDFILTQGIVGYYNISAWLHVLNCQCIEIIHLSVTKKVRYCIRQRLGSTPHQSPKMLTSILNENPGLYFERIGHQIKMCWEISQNWILTTTRIKGFNWKNKPLRWLYYLGLS